MGITQPIKFSDVKTLNTFYKKFDDDCKQICSDYNVSDFYETIKISKDEKEIELYILKMGSYIKGTDDEKAHKKILKAFEDIFNN